METWEQFIDRLAALEDEPTAEDINGRLTDRELVAWLDREMEMLAPLQIISDVIDEVDRDLDGQVDRNHVTAKIVLNALVAGNPQTVVWRILRDAMRRCALRDAGREVEALRMIDETQSALRRWVQSDSADADRRALAAIHNAKVSRGSA